MNYNPNDLLDDILSDDDDFFQDNALAKRSSLTKTESKPTVKKTKKTFDSEDDFLSSLGFPTKAKDSKPAEKPNLLENILTPAPSETKQVSFEPSLDNKKDAQFSLTFEGAREGRRGRRGSTGISDPLGLFSTSSAPETNQKTAPEPTKISRNEDKTEPIKPKSDLPDWLGGSSKNVEANQSNEPVIQLYKKDEKEIVPSDGDLFLQQQKLAQSNMDSQSAFVALQQQESQLLMALQLKKYEEGLVEIQKQQQEVLVKQEKQFTMLLDRYFAKQELMENNMRLQQERINSHIQSLIGHSPVGRVFHSEEMEKREGEEKQKAFNEVIEGLKQRHKEEQFLLEESYKKQIHLLEQSMEASEKRLKAEIENTSLEFQAKIETLKKYNEEIKEHYQNKIEQINSDHLTEIKQIKENYERILTDLKRDHTNQLENIKELKRHEESILREGGSFAEKIDQGVGLLQGNIEAINNLKQKVENDYGILSLARESSLGTREKEIQMMREALDKARESAEVERAQLLSLVRSLETKIAEQTQNEREERWALQQATATLTARSAAIEREAEFNRKSIEREREQLKTLKESLQAEQEKLISDLTEEKLQIAAEKSKLTTVTKLNTNFEVQRAKAELEAALQVAKDAAESAEREREVLKRQQVEMEKLRRGIKDREREMDDRERDLIEQMEIAERKARDGENAVKESKVMEVKLRERLNELQEQMASLGAREKKLAEEKIVLSKERLALYTAMRQSKKCGLCAVDNPGFHNDDVILEPAEDCPRFSSFSANDNRFRFEGIEEERYSEVSREDN